MSEPVIVYKALRQISEWTLSTFYSEVTVRGQENIPQNGPLIICSSHHNEIIDIATLAVTIPHQREVSFWAKSSMFKNPVSRFIMESSGAIPVMRNPNSRGATPNGTQPSESTAPTADSLFAATTRALLDGRVVGVFPEGTSYTEPRIMQVKEGAALAALEFVRADKASWEAAEVAEWEKGREEREKTEKEQRKAKEDAERAYKEWQLEEARLEAEAQEAKEREEKEWEEEWEEWLQRNEMAISEAQAGASEENLMGEEMDADSRREPELELEVDVQAETSVADKIGERQDRQEVDSTAGINGEQGDEWGREAEEVVVRADEANIEVGSEEKIEEEGENGTAIIIDTPAESAVKEEYEFTSEVQLTETAALNWTTATTGVETTPLQWEQPATYAPQYSRMEQPYSFSAQQEWQPSSSAHTEWQSTWQTTQPSGELIWDHGYHKPKAAPKERPTYTAGLSLVPVGIVYTDKSQYLSRASSIFIVVSYGAPIPIDRYLSGYLDPHEDSTPHATVERLTAEINSRMLELTIDAPDWDTHQACQMVRDILWPDDDMHLWNFPDISQTIVDIFSPGNASEEQEHVKKLLLNYSALLQYANMTHSAVSASLFYEYSGTAPTVLQTLRLLILRLILAFLDPRFILFVPAFVLHLPVYGTSLLASRLLANRELPETISQYKVIFGGAAMGAVYSWFASVVFKRTMSWASRFGRALGSNQFLLAAVRKITSVDLHGWEEVLGRVGGILGRVCHVAGAIGLGATAAATVFLLAKSHKYFVKGNLKRFRRLTACAKVLVGLASPASFSLPLDKVNTYFARPLIPPRNPFVKYETPAEERRNPAIPFIFSHRLIRHILDARYKTMTGLLEYLKDQPWSTRRGRVDAARATTLCEAQFLRRKFENHAAILGHEAWTRAQAQAEAEVRSKSD